MTKLIRGEVKLPAGGSSVVVECLCVVLPAVGCCSKLGSLSPPPFQTSPWLAIIRKASLSADRGDVLVCWLCSSERSLGHYDRPIFNFYCLNSTPPPPLSPYPHTTTNGDGGFFLAYEDWGRMFDHSFPACAFFFFFLKWRARAH